MRKVNKYRKKPVVIESIQWDGDNTYAVMSFMGTVVNVSGTVASDKFDEYKDIVRRDGLPIKTLEGNMVASVGDFIIKGVQGEFYPCKPGIFESTYEKVDAK